MSGVAQMPSLGTDSSKHGEKKAPVEMVLQPPSMLARYTCASICMAFFGIFFKYTFVPEEVAPGVAAPVHSYKSPLVLTLGYLVSLPLLKLFADKFVRESVDTKLLLREAMVLYNAGQVLLNGWMVYRFLDAVLFRNHPVVGDFYTVTSGATYTVWVHYCDKYLEFFDTYFMILRGRMDQVSFLHIYHHTSIAWAWWAAIRLWPGGDAYFGALLNSAIHVLMYSYYTLSLLKIQCPWKKYLTQAQLTQFVSVIVYTGISMKHLAGKASWNHYSAWGIQFVEMASMFVLFIHFYKKAYDRRKRALESADSTLAGDSVTEDASVSSGSTEDAEE